MNESDADNLQAKAAHDINEFISELRRETDRGAALVAAAVLDAKLKLVVEAHVVDGLTEKQKKYIFGRQGVLDTFASKIVMCHALGLINDDECTELDLLRDIRNDFAHESYGLSFRHDPILSRVNRLKWIEPVTTGGEPRAKFLCSTLAMMTRLYYRDLAVGYRRCKQRNWVNEDEHRYRTMVDEQPAPGQRVILFDKKGPIVATTAKTAPNKDEPA